MSVILLLILASLAVALVFLGGFVWAVRSGQFEDTCTPSMRILADETRCQTSAQPGAQSAPLPHQSTHPLIPQSLNPHIHEST